jgi:hypothetical protein
MKVRQKTRADYLRELLNDYLEAHGGGPVDLGDVYAWARRQRRWEAPPASQLRQFKEEVARAAREEYYTDPQGRRVRRKHAVVLIKEDGRQQSLWADIGAAPPEHMRLSLLQRRRGVLGDLAQLKADMDSYNQNNNPRPDRPIQLSFNFEKDLAEADQGPTDSDLPLRGAGG